MKVKRCVLFVLVGLCIFSMTHDASASRQNPGSCLLFPYFENNNQTVNVISITNVNSSEDLWVRLVWISDNGCNPLDFWFELTPRDTLTFTAKAVCPYQGTGFFYAYVVQGAWSTMEKDADFLIGQELVISNWDNQLANFSLNAVSFQCLNCQADGKLRLDGEEYTAAPATLYFPRFFGQTDLFLSKIVLINLTGGRYFDVETYWLISNDNEQIFSLEKHFDCFEVFKLADVGSIFYNSYLLYSNHDVAEPLGFASLVETGWIEITGAEAYNLEVPVVIEKPCIYGVLIENVVNLGYSHADLPFQIEDPEFNKAMLWSTDPYGS